MTETRDSGVYKKYSIAIVIACVACCLITSAAAIAVYYIYPRYMSRVANVRLAPESFRLSILSNFLSIRLGHTKNDAVLVIGDSQFYGYHQSWQNTFPAFMAESTNLDFINLSIPDGRWDDAILTLGLATDQRIKAVIYNVDLMHYAVKEKPDFQWLDKTRSVFPLYLFDPGKAWQFISTLNPPDGRQTFDWPGIPPEQFVMDHKSRTVGKLRAVLQTFERRGMETLVVMAPQQIASFAENGIDTAAVLRNNAFLMTVCREYKVTCIDVMDEFDISNFQDSIHLNTKGHRALAAALEPFVRQISSAALRE